MESFDVFVIGGGGTGSEVAFSLARHGGLRVGIAERDRLGGECNNYGCVPTKAMLASAKVAAAARAADRYGVRVPSVEVDFPAVIRRARQIIDRLGLAPHPERGYYTETYRAALSVSTAAGPRAARGWLAVARCADRRLARTSPSLPAAVAAFRRPARPAAVVARSSDLRR